MEKTINIKFILSFILRHERFIIAIILSVLSVGMFWYYSKNGLSLAYNDARSHLDIGRRVVEGLKPGLAQLGSVWLPLPHLLMVLFVWDNFMWHSGLAGALFSMFAFVVTGLLIWLWLRDLGAGLLGRVFGVAIFAANLNILYLQSTAMTELLLMMFMMAGSYYLLKWNNDQKLVHLLYAAVWIMLASLTRYEGWFLLIFAMILVGIQTFRKRGYATTEGVLILFGTLAGLGVLMWLLWNQLIFNDAFYFVFGPFSARSQQFQLEQAGVLLTKGNLLLSVKTYLYALIYNAGAFTAFLALCGTVALWSSARLSLDRKIGNSLLVVPVAFNILALFLGHSVLFIQGITGGTWFNVRYGAMAIPSVAILVGYFIHRVQVMKIMLVGLLIFVSLFSFISHDAVTIDDARVGSSQKNVSEVSGWLRDHVAYTPGFILISAASHDAIIFSSGLPMKRFIHEGTGTYWETATTIPDHWARWIIMRTYDDNDLTYRSIKNTPGFLRYKKVGSYPFADIYELKSEYISELNLYANLPKQK